MDKYTVRYVFDDEVTDNHIDDIFDYLKARCSIIGPSLGEYDTYEERLYEGRHVRMDYEGTVFDFRVGDPEVLGDLPLVNISIPERWILTAEDDSDQAAVDRMNDFYTFLGDLYEQFVDGGLTPIYVYGLDFSDYDKANNPEHVNYISRDRLLNGEVPGIYWFQIFPPTLVEDLGEDQVLSCPAFRLEQLADGAVLLAGYEGVHAFLHDDERQAAADHLGVPFDWAQVLSRVYEEGTVQFSEFEKLNVFSPRLVDTYGRETLLSAPVWKAEEWKDGHCLVQHLLDWRSPI